MPSTPGKALTLKQRRFVEEFAGEGCAVQAYMRAFGRYTAKGVRRSYSGASKAADRLLQNDRIKAEIAAAEGVYARKVRVSRMRVLRELAALAFADPDDVYEADPENNGLPAPKAWGDIPVAARRAIQSVKVKRKRLAGDKDATAWEVEELEYKFHAKTDALDKLCKRLGFYKDEDADASKQVAGVPVELVTRILALVGARQPRVERDGVASAEGGDAVGAEPRPAK